MAEYIEREALYQKIAELEMLARDRYLDTPTNSPVYSRYMAQLGERTQLKFLVADFPAADVEPVRHGRWEDKAVRDWHCSECGKKVPRQVYFDGYCYDDKLNYCPNCGARMDGENND